MECWMRLVHGSHPLLTLDWRRGHALISEGFLQLSLEATQPSAHQAPFDIAVTTIDPDGVAQQPQEPDAPRWPQQRALLMTTTAGNQRELALHAGDVDAALAALNCPAHAEEESEDMGHVDRSVDVKSRALEVGGDVLTDLRACWEDVCEQLMSDGMSPADITDVTVRTTSFPEARAQASELGAWLREAGAKERSCFEAIDDLPKGGQVVEVEVHAIRWTWVGEGGPPEQDPEDRTPVPEHLRAAVRVELDALVRSERPEMLTWVREYGEDGATLVIQPEEIWDHPASTWGPVDAGGWWVTLPLWTVTECPSELSAELGIDISGKATLETVRVM
ncbi:MAG: hypothetical protein PGN11_00005 [Quadrisphaera sp.]